MLTLKTLYCRKFKEILLLILLAASKCHVMFEVAIFIFTAITLFISDIVYANLQGENCESKSVGMCVPRWIMKPFLNTTTILLQNRDSYERINSVEEPQTSP